MEKAFAKVEELADTIKEYVNTKIESVKLTTAEKTSTVIANLIAGFAVAVFFILIVIFAGVAIGFGLGELLGKTWLGFLIVTGLYFLLGIIIWFARGRLIRLPIMNGLIRQLFKNESQNEED